MKRNLYLIGAGFLVGVDIIGGHGYTVALLGFIGDIIASGPDAQKGA